MSNYLNFWRVSGSTAQIVLSANPEVEDQGILIAFHFKLIRLRGLFFCCVGKDTIKHLISLVMSYPNLNTPISHESTHQLLSLNIGLNSFLSKSHAHTQSLKRKLRWTREIPVGYLKGVRRQRLFGFQVPISATKPFSNTS